MWEKLPGCRIAFCVGGEGKNTCQACKVAQTDRNSILGRGVRARGFNSYRAALGELTSLQEQLIRTRAAQAGAMD